MSESHMHYYPDHASALPDYLQDSAVQESYTMSYETTSNGHHRDIDASSNNSVPVDRASLISRSTSETKTESVVTNREMHKTVHHIGPDGKPIAYSPYGGAAYMYNAYPNPSHETYDTYDPGRPPSPAGQTASEREVYAHNFATYSTASPAKKPGRNLVELYGENMEENSYAEKYGSYNTDSPNLHRAMPQAPPRDYQPGNYEDIDATSLLPTGDSRYGTYGYSGEAIPASSPPGYECGTEGFLDSRPSFFEESARTPSGQPEYGYEAASMCESHSRGHPHLHYIQDHESGVEYRFPDLHEIIEFLHHKSPIVRANAAAYLGHLCYNDDTTKQKTRTLGAIPALILLLAEDVPEVQRNSLGALKNLSFGRQNNGNKLAIKNSEGIPALVRVLRKSSDDSELKELSTAILWNLSSCEELKKHIIDDALAVIVNAVIIPLSGYDRTTNPLDPISPNVQLKFSTVFRNASGVLRNVSSAGHYARKKLREAPGLVEALIYLLRAAVAKNASDNKSVENCMCVLRNLSYRCQEIEDPDYDKHSFPSAQSKSSSAPIRDLSAGLFAVSENLGCFGTKKKKEGCSEKRIPMTRNPIISSAEEIGGMSLLWRPEVVQCYLALLAECSNPETLEAAAGSIQNLTSCTWTPSLEIRASVRKDKGLPVLVELLKIESPRVICAIANALRNLAQDQRNKCLIGNYAIRDLVSKLPNSDTKSYTQGHPSHDSRICDDTIAAVLSTLNEVVSKETDFARSLFELGGVERLHKIRHGPYSPRVIKFASELLYDMYSHVELREAYKKAGFKETHFLHGPSKVRNSLSQNTSPTGTSSTLNRPNTQGSIKYEDRTGTHGNELNSTAAAIPYSRSEELPLSELSEPSQIHRPHMGVFPAGMAAPEPVYAQVNRDKKRGRQPEIPLQLHEPAGDSWV